MWIMQLYLEGVSWIYNELLSFVEVCRHRGMGVNINKSKAIVMKRDDAICEAQINGEMLELINEFKNLGYVIYKR